jgi:hypothetical protein
MMTHKTDQPIWRQAGLAHDPNLLKVLKGLVEAVKKCARFTSNSTIDVAIIDESDLQIKSQVRVRIINCRNVGDIKPLDDYVQSIRGQIAPLPPQKRGAIGLTLAVTFSYNLTVPAAIGTAAVSTFTRAASRMRSPEPVRARSPTVPLEDDSSPPAYASDAASALRRPPQRSGALGAWVQSKPGRQVIAGIVFVGMLLLLLAGAAHMPSLLWNATALVA